METIGTLPELIRNDAGLYTGNLVPYFRIIFTAPTNLQFGYHNFRHMMHVFWLCYRACVFYRDILSQKERRELLIAALFHDFDHTGKLGSDDVNITLAIRGLRKHILPEDRESLATVEALIAVTEYPYRTTSVELPLREQIIRDADLCQAFSTAWIQQVIFGLASEWGMKPIEVLRKQGPFLEALKFSTAWAKETFSPRDIQAKIKEARALVELLSD